MNTINFLEVCEMEFSKTRFSWDMAMSRTQPAKNLTCTKPDHLMHTGGRLRFVNIQWPSKLTERVTRLTCVWKTPIRISTSDRLSRLWFPSLLINFLSLFEISVTFITSANVSFVDQDTHRRFWNTKQMRTRNSSHFVLKVEKQLFISNDNATC